MKHSHFTLFTLFGAMQSITCVFDTSNYIRQNDLIGANFTFWDAKCRDLGSRWFPAILDSDTEFLVLERVFGFSNSWIGGSSDANQDPLTLSSYSTDYSGAYRVSLTNNKIYSSIPSQDRKSVICEQNKDVVDGNQFTTDYSFYQKVFGFLRQNYTYWSLKCNELGDGCSPATLNSQEELDFILGAHRLSELQYYWISGSTNVSDGSTIYYAIDQYLPNSSGHFNVLINGRKKLKSKPPSHLTPGILCGKDKGSVGLELISTTGRYMKKIRGNEPPVTYEEWVNRCSEIGIGWKPAFFDNRAEQEFIKQGQKTFRNSAPYWISGSALYDPSVIVTFGDAIFIPGPPSIIYTPRIETPNPDFIVNISAVFVQTHVVLNSGTGNIAEFNNKYNFHLQYKSRESALDAILCEKAEANNGLEFESATIKYKKVIGSANDYTFYASKCKDLGDGWAPATIDSNDEYDFVNLNIQRLSDHRFSFIGGHMAVPFSDLRKKIHDIFNITRPSFSYSRYSPRQQGRVLVFDRFGFHETPSNETAILCEKDEYL